MTYREICQGEELNWAAEEEPRPRRERVDFPCRNGRRRDFRKSKSPSPPPGAYRRKNKCVSWRVSVFIRFTFCLRRA